MGGGGRYEAQAISARRAGSGQRVSRASLQENLMCDISYIFLSFNIQCLLTLSYLNFMFNIQSISPLNVLFSLSFSKESIWINHFYYINK